MHPALCQTCVQPILGVGHLELLVRRLRMRPQVVRQSVPQPQEEPMGQKILNYSHRFWRGHLPRARNEKEVAIAGGLPPQAKVDVPKAT